MADETVTEQDESQELTRPAAPPPPTAARAPGGAPFRPYKPGQGAHVRWGTAIGAGVIAVAGARFLFEWLRLLVGDSLVLQTTIPVVLLVVAAYLIFWLVGKSHGTVDFMIATEGEMKKVNWSTRKEVLGATRVVIFTVLVLGFLLFMVDVAFMLLFSSIGVLKMPVWQALFGGGEAQP